MDTKRLITMMLISFAVIFGWQIFIAKLFDRHPEWKRPGQQASTRPVEHTAPAAPTTTTSPSVAIAPAPATAPAVAATVPANVPTMSPATVRVVAAATQPAVVTLGGDKSKFQMDVKIASAGAGLESVTLLDFPAPGGKKEQLYTFQQPFDPKVPETRALATRSVTVNGTEIGLAGVNWIVEKQDATSATFMVDLGPVRVRKIYELTDRNAAGKGYELLVRHAIETSGDQPAKVKVLWNGAVTPPRENERGPDLQVIAGYDDGYQRVAIEPHMAESYDEKKPTLELTQNEDKQPVLWVGTASVYFSAFVRPLPLDAAVGAAPKYLAHVVSGAMNPAAEAYQRHIVTQFETTELTVAPGHPLALPASVFLGPRWRSIVRQPHFAQFPLQYDQTLVMTAGPCGFCTFHWLIDGLVWLLGIFYALFRDWGLAIIVLVILVRGALHPITKRSQISMMRMGKLGPEMERLKQKYGEDKEELNRQVMQLYKSQGIGAYLGCLPMFLQMPIWIALWSALNTTFELRQAPFLYGLTWIDDLSRPDRLIEFGRTLNLPFGLYFSSINLLPVLLGVVFYIQQELTPKPPATTPEAEMQQKMMKWMSLLFPLFLYNGPSGLNLYILTSTTIGIIESKRIRDHIKQKEEEEKAGKVIVDAGISKKKKRDEDDDRPGGPKKKPGPKPAPKTGLAGFLEQLQAKAEEIKRQAEKK